MITATGREWKVPRAGVVLVATVAVLTLLASAHRMYASEPGCADVKCDSNTLCKQNRCDLCHGDGRCALIADPD